ncbi:MAG: flagellar biosynthesis repressor FlbT [Sphingomonas bacterium]
MLRITLRDGEKAIINGAVIRASGRVQIAIENQVTVLRGREVMKPEEATTPARQLYFATMLAYIDPAGREAYQDNVVELIAHLVNALPGEAAHAACVRFAAEAGLGDFYRALSSARELIAFEDLAAGRTELAA